MAPLAQETMKYTEQEEKLFRELDKGIDDMEKGNTMSHEDSMKQIRERLKKYAVQVTNDKGSNRRCCRNGRIKSFDTYNVFFTVDIENHCVYILRVLKDRQDWKSIMANPLEYHFG